MRRMWTANFILTIHSRNGSQLITYTIVVCTFVLNKRFVCTSVSNRHPHGILCKRMYVCKSMQNGYYAPTHQISYVSISSGKFACHFSSKHWSPVSAPHSRTKKKKKKKKYTKTILKLALEFIAFSDSRALANSEHKDARDDAVNTAYSFAFGTYVGAYATSQESRCLRAIALKINGKHFVGCQNYWKLNDRLNK